MNSAERTVIGMYKHYKNNRYAKIKENFIIYQGVAGDTTRAKLFKESEPKMEAHILFLSSWQGNPIGGNITVKRNNKYQVAYFRVGKNVFSTWAGKEKDPVNFPIDCPFLVSSTFISIRNHFISMLNQEKEPQFVKPTIWISTGSNNIHPASPVRLDGRLSKTEEKREGLTTKTLEEKYEIEIFTQSPFPAKKHVFWYSPELKIISEWEFEVKNTITRYVLENVCLETRSLNEEKIEKCG